MNTTIHRLAIGTLSASLLALAACEQKTEPTPTSAPTTQAPVVEDSVRQDLDKAKESVEHGLEKTQEAIHAATESTKSAATNVETAAHELKVQAEQRAAAAKTSVTDTIEDAKSATQNVKTEAEGLAAKAVEQAEAAKENIANISKTEARTQDTDHTDSSSETQQP